MKIKTKDKIICISIALILISLVIYGLIRTYNSYKEDYASVIIKPNIPIFFEQDAREGLLDALLYYNIQDAEIVYCMAYLETGNFNSRLCNEENNILGLYDSKNNTFFKFSHWTECVIAYKEMVEYKRNESESMYSFLNRITYAEDPDYINKIKYLRKALFNE